MFNTQRSADADVARVDEREDTRTSTGTSSATTWHKDDSAADPGSGDEATAGEEAPSEFLVVVTASVTSAKASTIARSTCDFDTSRAGGCDVGTAATPGLR